MAQCRNSAVAERNRRVCDGEAAILLSRSWRAQAVACKKNVVGEYTGRMTDADSGKI